MSPLTFEILSPKAFREVQPQRDRHKKIAKAAKTEEARIADASHLYNLVTFVSLW